MTIFGLLRSANSMVIIRTIVLVSDVACGVFAHLAKSFYWWRRRLRENDAVRFAVVETLPVPTSVGLEPVLELVLANGERLRIAQGVDATTLRLTLDAIRV